MEAEMMKDIIFLFVKVEPGVEEGVLIKKILDLEDVGGGEDELGDLLFVHR